MSERVMLRVGEALSTRRPPLLLGIAVTLCYAGVALLRPGLPQGLAFVDPILLGLVAYAVVSMMYQGSPATSGARRLVPWVWFILLGSFLGLAQVGIPLWAISNLARTLFALMTFVCLWQLLVVARVERFAIAGTIVGFVITAGLLVVQASSTRGTALFPHSNYAGHYVVMAGFLLISVARAWWWKVLVILGLILAVQQTSSFGAIAMAVAMLGVYAFRALTRSTAILAVGLALLAIVGLFLATPSAADLVPDDSGGSWEISPTISEDRLDRSGDSRVDLWSQGFEAYLQSPLGLGPDGVKQRQVAVYRGHALEIHSDAIGYLIERGVLGLIGFVGLWVTLFRLARKGGLARVLMAGMIVQGMFRETMHYRHGWLLLALAFALDRRERPSDDEDVGEILEVHEVPSPLDNPGTTPSIA